jgi:acyl carrier protein phosphodiesterase
LYLSEPTAAFRIGNVLPDLVSQSSLKELPPKYLPGVQCHHRIDAFTDSHPVFRRSIARLDRAQRRFGGVLMDMFYDHFLAAEWNRFSDQSLEEFTKSVYADFDEHLHELPATATDALKRMRAGDWLGSYRTVEGIRIALNRIGARLRKPQILGVAVGELESHYEPLQKDFHEFFPLLRAHV